MMVTVNTDDPVVRSFIFSVLVLIAKTLFMAPLTGRLRFAKKIFLSPEDTVFLKKATVSYTNPDIERVRRAHLNDLENIPFFIFAGVVYLLTNPSAWIASFIFRACTISRIFHTIVYAVYVVPQPARVISFVICYGLTWYMVIVSLVHFI